MMAYLKLYFNKAHRPFLDYQFQVSLRKDQELTFHPTVASNDGLGLTVNDVIKITQKIAEDSYVFKKKDGTRIISITQYSHTTKENPRVCEMLSVYGASIQLLPFPTSLVHYLLSKIPKEQITRDILCGHTVAHYTRGKRIR